MKVLVKKPSETYVQDLEFSKEGLTYIKSLLTYKPLFEHINLKNILTDRSNKVLISVYETLGDNGFNCACEVKNVPNDTVFSITSEITQATDTTPVIYKEKLRVQVDV